MRLKAVSGIILTLLFVGMLILAFNIQPVEASGTIYIRADGSVEGTTYISTIDNITYTFTDNINDSIVVERDNIVVDGAGYILYGPGYLVWDSIGVSINGRNNITIRDIRIESFNYGIYLNESSNSNIHHNHVVNNYVGFGVFSSSCNNLSRNNVTANYFCGTYVIRSSGDSIYENNITNVKEGVFLSYSSSNIIFRNDLKENKHGIWIGSSVDNIVFENDLTQNLVGIDINYSSDNNTIYHNSFINNQYQVHVNTGHTNVWDNGYPSGGNYWSDYTGTDLYSGSYQNETGSDGIGDTPYVIDENNADKYPLMNPWGPSPVIGATIDVDPDALNLKSKGKWITCYVELSKGFNVTGIDRTTILLNGTIPVDPFWVDKPFESVIGDYDNDSIPDLMVKFNRAAVIAYLLNQNITYGYVTLTVTGELYNGTQFEGSDMIMAKIPSKAIEKIPCEVDAEGEYVPVMPEFPSLIILPLFMITTLLTVVYVKKRKRHTEINS